MPRTMKSRAILMLSLAALSAPAFGQIETPAQPTSAQSNNAQPASAQPGTLNYVEGQASLNGSALNSRSVGNATLEPGQLLETGNGRAEILLTPGVFLRLGDNSALKMIAPDLTHTEVSLVRGKADIEVNQVFKQNDLLVDQGGTQTQLLQTGLYAFDKPGSTLRVFNGKAAVFPINSDGNAKPVLVKGDRQLELNSDDRKPDRFDKKASQDGLYDWSSLRSQYLGEENQNLAANYAGVGGFNPGWYWDSAYLGYSWLPGDGAFLSPFGYGFYSPFYFGGGYGGFGYGGFGRYGGYRGGAYTGRGLRGPVNGTRASGFAGGGYRGGSVGGGGFHGGSIGGGGFHGGGGGFHGGGGGGHR